MCIFVPFSAHILFVVQKNEGNIYDHRLMEQDLFNRLGLIDSLLIKQSYNDFSDMGSW